MLNNDFGPLALSGIDFLNILNANNLVTIYKKNLIEAFTNFGKLLHVFRGLGLGALTMRIGLHVQSDFCSVVQILNTLVYDQMICLMFTNETDIHKRYNDVCICN